MADRYVDVAVFRGEDGIYDFRAENGDLVMAYDLTPSCFVSLFTDRRAADDEVADPLKRRGWLGNAVTGDNWGSGIWLYEQSRMRSAEVAGVRVEAESCLDWMVDAGIATHVTATAEANDAQRTLAVFPVIHTRDGQTQTPAFEVIRNTRTGNIGVRR